MARQKREEYESQEFKDDWLSRTPLKELALKYGVSIASLWVAANRRDFPPRRLAWARNQASTNNAT